ncbi:thioredoxin family protein [Seonamhaeicola aphaedonensis]|uniref:Protein disulfide-isomerase n=1 Tax=Seonamhaeicola aphaedonensis TaxID=1461338 RepID=A0A3D9HL08_9FLAO|nr:thioredoxin family protein [Seonamhaeicola aphaedonensis]RED50192.1 protein disulfide-isomerase [Seonamhaeicola aphaedonensis]
MKKVFFLIFFVTLSSSKTFSQQRVQWHTDLNLALNEASKENKKILLFFTGSDWCGWCKRLQNEVFKTSDFEEWSNSLVLVELDFPRRTPQDQKIKNQNLQLQSMFQVRGYPTVHFVIPEKMNDGRTNLKSLGKTGYVRGGPTAWLNVANNIINKTL